MTACVVITCDGTWDDGRMPCRGAYPSRTPDVVIALRAAVARGWRHIPGSRVPGTETYDRQLCPAHAHILAEKTA